MGIGQFADLRGDELGKNEGVVFLRGGDTPMQTMTIWKVFLNKIE